MTEQAQVPRLAGDTYRAWTAMVPVVVVGVGVTVGWTLTRRGVTVDELITFTVGSYLFVLAGYFLVYDLLTIRVFGGRNRAQLVRYAEATAPRRRSEKIRRALSGGGAVSWAVSTSVLALLSVVVIAFTPALRSSPLMLTAGGVLVVAGWVTVPVSFAVHYLRRHLVRPGFRFPGDEEPVFVDFLYLAFQISTTFSTSDVEVLTRVMRRRVTAHALVAFVFNSVIVALLVSALLLSVPK